MGVSFQQLGNNRLSKIGIILPSATRNFKARLADCILSLSRQIIRYSEMAFEIVFDGKTPTMYFWNVSLTYRVVTPLAVNGTVGRAIIEPFSRSEQPQIQFVLLTAGLVDFTIRNINECSSPP